jgi:hypothetical protein
MRKIKFTHSQVNYTVRSGQAATAWETKKIRFFSLFLILRKIKIVPIVPIVPSPVEYGQKAGRSLAADRPPPAEDRPVAPKNAVLFVESRSFS